MTSDAAVSSPSPARVTTGPNTATTDDQKPYKQFQPDEVNTFLKQPRGPLQKPIFTKQCLDDFRKQFSELMQVKVGQKTSMLFVNVRGDPIKVELHLEENGIRTLRFIDDHGRHAKLTLNSKDLILIRYSGIMNLASFKITPDATLAYCAVKPLLSEREQHKMVMFMNQLCPLSVNVFPHNPSYPAPPRKKIEESLPAYEARWLISKVRHVLEDAVKKYAAQRRAVNKVVCFGAGKLFANERNDSARSYVQHLAACGIAEWIGCAQSSDRNKPVEIPVYAQDPMYRPCDRQILKEKLGIKVVDAAHAEGLTLVDSRTFIFCVGVGADVLEAAVDLAGPHGPAGLLDHKMSMNGEAKWWEGSYLGPGGPYEAARNEVSDRVWRWKETCKAFDITDDEFFGFPPREVKLKRPIRVQKDDGSLEVLAAGPQEEVKMVDADGKQVMSKFDTELLLAPL